MVTARFNDMQASMIYIPIAIGIITTFLLFWSISGLMLRIVMSMKNLYYKGLNSFVLRQVSSKINTAVCQMSIICLMLFVTICVLSSSLSIKNSMTANLISLAPADIQIDKKMNLDESAPESGYTASQIEDSYVSISETLTRLGFDPNTYLRDIVEIPIYATNDITIRSTLGSSYETMLEMYPYLQYDNAEMLLSVSDYNRLAELYNLEKITLEQDLVQSMLHRSIVSSLLRASYWERMRHLLWRLRCFRFLLAHLWSMLDNWLLKYFLLANYLVEVHPER